MHRLRYTIRKLARTPLFTTVAVFTLALGIGANTAVFSVVNSVLLEPLSFDEPDELIGVWHTAPGIGFDELNQSPALYFTYREESEVFAGSGMWSNSSVSVTGREEPEQVSAIRVTDGVFRSFQKLRDVEPGFTDPDTLLTMRVVVPEAEIEDPIATFQLQKAMLDALGELPGVESVAMTTSATMDGWESADPVFVESRPTPAGQIPLIRRFKWIAPGYFATMGNPLVAGRDFTWAELYDRAEVVIINEKLAGEYWDNPAQAVGERIRQAPEQAWRTIVGVVGSVYDDGVDQELTAIAYWPTLQDGFWFPGTNVHRSMRYVLRSERVGTAALLDEARQAIWNVNPNLPVASVRTMGEVLARSMARTSFTLTMLGIAAAAAMLIGAVGIYGVTSYIVAQRTREIGVRMALGAQYTDINRMVLRHGLMLCGIGVLVGLVGAFALSRLMSALLFGVSPMDPVTYGSVAGAVTLVALIACYLPARRAAGLDPVEALRT